MPYYLLLISLTFLIIFMFIMISFNMNTMIKLLITYSILIFTILSFWSKNYLYSIIMFLTLISGMLIIFLYFTSLISNLKYFYFKNILIFMSFILNIFMFFYLSLTQKYSPHTSLLSLTSMDTTNSIHLNEKMIKNILNIFLYPFNNFTLLCIFFLMLSLFSIIKICSIKNSSLRKINK